MSPTLRFAVNEMLRHRSIVATAIATDLVASVLDGTTFAALLITFSILSGGAPTTGKLAILASVLTSTSWTPRTQLVVLMATTIALQVIRSGLMYVSAVLARRLAFHAEAALRAQLSDRILAFSYRHVSSFGVGDLANRVLVGSQQVGESIASMNSIMLSGILIVSYMGAMLVVSGALGVIAIVLFAAAGAWNRVLFRKIGEHSGRVAASQRTLADRVVQLISSIRLVHMFGGQQRAQAEVRLLSGAIANAGLKRAYYYEGTMPASEALLAAATGLFVIIGFLLAPDVHGSFVPKLLTLAVLLQRLGNRIKAMVGEIGRYRSAAGSRSELDAILADGRHEYERVGTHTISAFERDITIEDLTLQYEGGTTPALSKANFVARKGTVTALVGASGSGKSTLVDLIVGLADPTAGKIRIDGRDLATIELRSWRSLLGIVSQEIILFSASVADNIRYGKLDATQDEVRAAAKAANADEFICAMPNGYDTVLGERGYGLSGGQRQRIALARALVRRPEILILDEATSALDSESEKLFQEAVDGLSQNCTIIVVAHRLSTIAKADQILVLANGHIVERGTHRELLQMNGLYARSWDIQSASRPADMQASRGSGLGPELVAAS